MKAESASQNFPTSVLLFTQNITRHPIAWDPARQRPTQEVIHAVHSALHFALDPCVDHPDEPLSFGVQDGVLVIPNVSVRRIERSVCAVLSLERVR